VFEHKTFIQILAVSILGLCLGGFVGPIPALAQSGGSYSFLVGSGFLCDADSSACPAVVKSLTGDSYEMSGAGVLDAQRKSVTAAGTFTRKSPDGNALETGVWIASELVSFESYGVAAGALTSGGLPFGSAAFGPMRSRMFASAVPSGGLAVFQILLVPMRGVSKTGTLQVNCALGKVPPDHATEGIRLTLDGDHVEFDQEISGRSLFVLTRLPHP
jgi:hypothetical protein